MRFAAFAVFCSLASVLSSCAHKYNAPDPARVIAATKRVETSAAAAHASHQQERAKIQEAQAAADSITVASQTLLEKVDSLAGLLPPEFQPPLAEIRGDVTDLQAKETVLTTGLVQGWQKSDETEKHLTATDTNIAVVKTEQTNYFAEAQRLADIATAKDRKLVWYQWHFWGSWIALGSGIVACLLFAFLKFTAKGAAITAGLAAKYAR